MMKKLALVLIWSLSIFIPTLSEAQTSAPQLGNYSDEQIHLQLSESIVGVGESIWFQANITRSEEHTSELQSQSTISYAVFCLKKKKNK